MRQFLTAITVTIIALILAIWWGGLKGFFVCLLLMAMDVSFSFDNAVVNATVLKHMERRWQRQFLTWGMVIAVFGMYYLFPLIVVALASHTNIIQVAHMAISVPAEYTHHLEAAHSRIAAFGGMFLLMVFLYFLMNEKKKLHWLGSVEAKLAKLGKLEAAEIAVALFALLALQYFLSPAERLPTVIAGVIGIALYVAIHSVTAIFGMEKESDLEKDHSGFAGFIYLCLLDASFSIDAVVGSFAISRDIVLIVLGLTAGAMFVRSLTVHMVRKNTLDRYVFLEHGAHYGIGALAALMLVSILVPVPEVVAGLVGIVFILLSLYSSVRYNRNLLKK